MPVSDHLFKRAVELSKAGKKDDARKLLNYILKQDPQNEAAWLWYADTFADPARRKMVLQKVLEINPANPHALTALESIRSAEKPAPAPKPVPPPPRPVKPAATSARSQARSASARSSKMLPFPLLLGFILCLAAGILWGAEKIGRMQQDYLALSVENQEVTLKYTQLQQNYNNLVSQNQELANTNRNLSDKIQGLTDEYIHLRDAYADLSARHASLTGEYEKLDREAVKPPYIWIHEREVKLAFYGLDQQLLYWIVPFEALEWAINYGDDLRDDPPTKGLRNSNGESFLVTDYNVFVDPQMFDNVIPDLYWRINDADAFVHQAWFIVTQLSQWAKEEGDIPRTPLETLLAGGGDCEDLSILMASLLKAAPVDWKVELVLMDSNNLQSPINANHMIVSVEYGGRRRLIETTNPDVMEPYTDGVTGWYFEVK